MRSHDFKREERIVSIVGIFIIIGLLILGIYKNEHEVKEEIHINETSSSIHLTKDYFKFEVGERIPMDLSYYLDSEDIEGWKIDLGKVEETQIGTYPVKISNGTITKKFHITMQDATAPVMKLKNKVVTWTLDGNEDVDDLKHYVQASAIDKVDGDLSAYIVGWPNAIPEQEGTVVYTLRVRDRSKNIASTTLTVHYVR